MLQTNDYLSVANNTVHYTVQYKFQLYNQTKCEQNCNEFPFIFTNVCLSTNVPSM